jgi:hypothetical protein
MDYDLRLINAVQFHPNNGKPLPKIIVERHCISWFFICRYLEVNGDGRVEQDMLPYLTDSSNQMPAIASQHSQVESSASLTAANAQITIAHPARSKILKCRLATSRVL